MAPPRVATRPLREVRDGLLYLSVWALLFERLWLAVVFFFQDARFLVFQRARLRRRVAELIRTHGAVTGER